MRLTIIRSITCWTSSSRSISTSTRSTVDASAATRSACDGVRQPLAEPAGDLGVAQLGLDHLRRHEVLPDEGAEALAELVLLALDDRGVRDRDAQRVLEQRGHREPVGQRADHAGLARRRRSRPRRAAPLRLRPPADQEHHRGADQEAQRDHLHPAQAAAPLGVGRRSRRRRSDSAKTRSARPAARAGPVNPVLPEDWSVCHSLHHPLSRHREVRPCQSYAADSDPSAVVSSRSRERTSAIVAQQTPPGAVKTDGRKRRWHQHKVERRNELVDGTLEAIRQRGSNVSMDEIAAEIGVSKTVLYRYFVDKNDLTTAVMMRFAQTTLIPNMAAALSSNLRRLRPDPRDHPGLRRDRRRRTRAVPVRDGEQLGEQEQGDRRQRADHRPHARGHAAQADGGCRHGHRRRGAVGVSHVGGVQLATHSWMSHPRMSSDELIDYLTMLSWNALCGIVEVGGSLEKFTGNGTPVAAPAATIAQTMSKSDELPDPWTHEPHDFLVYREGDRIEDVDTRATPGFKGNKSDAADLQPERNERFAELQEMLYANSRAQATTSRCCWCCRAWTPQARAGSSNTLSERPIRRASGTTHSACRPRKSASTTTCGGSGGRCPRRATSACSTGRTTRTC